MKTRQILGLILALSLCVSLFAACGGGDTSFTDESANDGANGGTSVSESSETNTGINGEIVKLRIWGMTNSATNPDIDEVAEAISQLTRDKIGVEIEMIRSNDGEKLNLALTSGEQLDLVNMHTFSGGLPSMVSTGYCTPMDDLLVQYGQDIMTVVPEDYLRCGTIDGQLYMIPSLKDTARATGFAMRQDILDELHIDASTIKTWDDVHDVFVKVKEVKPDMYPLVPTWASGGMQDVIPYDNLGGGQGVLENCFEDSTTVVNFYETDAYREFCERMYQWKQEGLIYPDATTTTESNLMSTVGFAAYDNIKPGKVLECKKSGGVDVVLIEMTPPYCNTLLIGGSSFIIPTISEHPDKAMQLLSLMFTDPEISNLFINGIEGKHWVYTDDTKLFITTPEGVDPTASGYESLDWAWPNMRITPVWEGGDADLWQQMDDFTTNARQSPALGFRFDSTNVMNEITACSNVVSKYNIPLRWGELDPDEALPKFNDELKAAGVDTIIAEKQRQLDEWLAAQ
ncbi:MAG: ABC transporter substrate-binding protein [Acutalibacter sp.]